MADEVEGGGEARGETVVEGASGAGREQAAGCGEPAAAHEGCGCACEGRPLVVTVERRRPDKWLTAVIAVAVALIATCCVCCTAAVTSVAFSALGVSRTISVGPKIAVYQMNQTIGTTSGITPEDVRAVVKAVEEDSSVVALVVRCNCSGGGAAASEEISEYFASCSKPVVFSVGGTCASGAYMAASQTDWIVANASSSVGSIGTIMTVYDLEGLYEKLGVAVESIKSSDSKDMGASYRSLTDEERESLQAQVDRVNEMFVERVAEGRGLDVDAVWEWADGTTYLGEDAAEMGMIDEVGTYDDALRKAAELGGRDLDDCSVVDATSVL